MRRLSFATRHFLAVRPVGSLSVMPDRTSEHCLLLFLFHYTKPRLPERYHAYRNPNYTRVLTAATFTPAS